MPPKPTPSKCGTEESKQLSAWDRRKQYMQNVYRRRKATVPKTATKRKIDDIGGSAPGDSLSSQRIEKENILGLCKPKRLRRSASYTVLPTKKVAVPTVLEVDDTSNISHVDKSKTPVGKHMSLQEHNFQNESPVVRQNTFTITDNSEKDKNDNSKVFLRKSLSPQNTATVSSFNMIPKGKLLKSRAVHSRYMNGVFPSSRRQTLNPQFKSTKVEVGNKRATISSVEIPKNGVSCSMQRVTSLVPSVLRGQSGHCSSSCNPRPTKTSLLRQRLLLSGKVNTSKRSNSSVKQSRTKTLTPGNSVQGPRFPKAARVDLSRGSVVERREDSTISKGTRDDPLLADGIPRVPKDPERAENNSSFAARTPHRQKSVHFVVPDGTFSNPSNITLRKTPKKALTLRERLDVWFSSKDLSPHSYRHLRCFGLQLSELKKQTNQERIKETKEMRTEKSDLNDISDKQAKAKSVSSTEGTILKCIDLEVKNIIPELKQMLIEGYKPKDVQDWLREVKRVVPAIEQEVAYWECRALVAKNMGNMDEAVDIFNEAVERGVEPAEQLARALSALLLGTPAAVGDTNQMDELPRPSTPLSSSDRPKLISSSVVRYSINKTPKIFKKISRALELDSPEYLTVVTPVRRSRRLMEAATKHLDHSECVDSLEELPPEFRRKALLQRNTTLDDL